jgi:6-phosphogluconolactonase
VAVHPSGRFVYASNRGHDSIAVFSVDATTGMVQSIQHELTQGKTPRHFALDPSAKWLLAENQDSNTVVVFSVGETGRLMPTGLSQSLVAPVCAVFVAKQ